MTDYPWPGERQFPRDCSCPELAVQIQTAAAAGTRPDTGQIRDRLRSSLCDDLLLPPLVIAATAGLRWADALLYLATSEERVSAACLRHEEEAVRTAALEVIRAGFAREIEIRGPIAELPRTAEERLAERLPRTEDGSPAWNPRP